MPAPLSGLNIANFPSDILYNTGTVFLGSQRFGVTKGPPKTNPNRTFDNIGFDGKYAPVKGLDRVIQGEPSIAFSMLEVGSATSGNQIATLEPGSASTSATAPSTPGTLTATPSASGGTLTSATYYYKWTALNAGGESLASGEATAVVTGPNGSVALTGTAVSGATAYRWYRGTAAGAENTYFQSASNSFTDTGAAGTIGAPPAGGSGTTTTITPASAGSLLSAGQYVTDFRVLWERGSDGSGLYFAVYMPTALCAKWDVAGQDKKEALVAVEFVGRIDPATQALTAPAYKYEYRNSLP